MSTPSRGSAEGRARAHATKIRRSRGALTQALRELVDESYEKYGTGVTVGPREVAARAGVSVSTLYNRFPQGLGEVAVEAVAELKSSGISIHHHLALLADFHRSSLPVDSSDVNARAISLASRGFYPGVASSKPTSAHESASREELKRLMQDPTTLSARTRAQVLLTVARALGGPRAEGAASSDAWQRALDAQRAAGYDVTEQVEALKGSIRWWWGDHRRPRTASDIDTTISSLDDLEQAAARDRDDTLSWLVALLVSLSRGEAAQAGGILLSHLESTDVPQALTPLEMERLEQMCLAVIQLKLLDERQASILANRMSALVDVASTGVSWVATARRLAAAIAVMRDSDDHPQFEDLDETVPEYLLPLVIPESGLCSRIRLGLSIPDRLRQEGFIGRCSVLLMMSGDDVVELCEPIIGRLDRSAPTLSSLMSDDGWEQRHRALVELVWHYLRSDVGLSEAQYMRGWLAILDAETDRDSLA